ncbi:MAG: LacI family DNA-binding transcriptional regulator, partial [Clostridiales bacterium]|nr:LacI family DNA-binding transcriptional regulator [Clostridiales bacterium]
MNEEKDGTNTRQSEKKRATNRDVARLAGVSVATVSYVMNDRKDQHISDATKKKVYQAINILNYAPNHYAVGLNTKQLQSIAVRSAENASLYSEVELLYFLRQFRPVCEANGYQLLYSVEKRPAQIASTACLCFDMSNEEFHALANENYIPVVA